MILPVLTTSLGVLYNCDCLELLRSIKDESVDCVFADPPFNLGKDYGDAKVNDRLEKKEYLDWSFAWLEECARILKPGGTIFIYILPQWAYHFAVFLDEHLTFRHWIAVSMKGTFPRGRKLYPAHYALLYFTKGMPTRFNRVRLRIPVCRHCGKDIKDYGGHRKYLNPAGLNLTDFWDDTSPNRHRKFKVRKINELKPMIPRRAIQISTIPGDIVVDPFGGGGSTYQTAEELKRFWVGSEIADCEPIISRFQERIGLTASGRPPEEVMGIFRHPARKYGFRVPWR
ncbi:MAG: site-specific DNA-methyltransferase [Candidatus Rokubacteria bacterium]|nr:site-specific DNA-methyltransferase [Candidatus Rokubacteria bacterium]